jgi:ADP-L-glycero-D-manno-heptose 6-epimerase
MILVTGSKGFIGRNLIKRLESQDYEVMGIDFIGCSNVFDAIMYAPWDRIKRVYHLGAETDTTCENTERLIDLNVRFTLTLFEYALANKVPVHYASSAAVYGNSKDYSYNPLNQYAMSKLWVDMHVKKLNNNLLRGFRFYNVYGLYENKSLRSSIVWKFIEQAWNEKEVKVFEGSENIFRDFICIDDALDQFTRKDLNGGIYDVGTGTPTNVLDIAVAVCNLTGVGMNVVPFPDHLINKYQYYTRAPLNGWKAGYKTVNQWLEENI